MSLDALADVPLAGRFVREVGLARARAAGIETQRLIYEINRRIISGLIDDVVRASRARLAALPSQSLEGVRAAAEPVIALSTERRAEVEGLQDYLFANVYRHPRVTAVMAGAETIVSQLFARYMGEPALMPEPWSAAAETESGADSEAHTETGRAGVVADFVAGMTDRYAEREHRRLFDATPDLR